MNSATFKKLKSFSLRAALLSATVLASDAVFASTGQDVLGIKGPLQKLLDGMTAVSGVILTMGIIAIAWSFIFSEHGSPFKNAARIIGAGAIVFGAVTLVPNLFPNGSGMLF